MLEPDTSPPEPVFDNGHASHHFIQGQYPAAITQKVRVGERSFHIDTPVDDQGNVGETKFDLGS